MRAKNGMVDLEKVKEQSNKEWLRKNIRTCPECHKQFSIAPYNVQEYLYKQRDPSMHRTRMYCSYTCWCKSTK